jgi:DNA-binding beta-propeller fold protein YncE
MRESRLFALLIIFSIGFFTACERNDDEPVLPRTEISRLYVSFFDVQTDDLEDPYNNIGVFDPAHAEQFLQPFEYNSGVLEGAGIYFDPFAGKVFQGSLRDRSIKSFSVNSQGAVGTGSTFRDSTLVYQRDLVYDHSSKNLYVSDNLSESIYVYFQALNRNGNIRPNKKFKLTGQPWGLHLQGDTTRGDSLFIVMAGAGAEVQLLQNLTKIDSGDVAASKKIKISGATDLRGITFSDRLNTLFLTDFGSGRVYIVENAREAFDTQGIIIPTRVIGGAQTQLQTPIDISVDDREDKLLIYVIDRESKKLLRFKISDEGNVLPEDVYNQFALTPVSIYIDAR